MDLIARALVLPEKGHSVMGHDFSMVPGGKGGNQACQCALMGAETFMLTGLGDDLFGRDLLASLQSKGVDTSHIVINATKATGASTVLAAADGYSSVIYPGAAAALTVAEIESALTALGALDALILQLELPVELVLAAARFGFSKNIPIVLNYSPAPATVPEELLSLVSILVANDAEANTLGNIDRFNIATVIITHGADGASARQGGKTYRQKAYPAKVVDTVGAGDGFLGTLIVGLCEGQDMPTALSWAAATGALAVGKAGGVTALPSLADIKGFLARQPGA
jgi:ribokinase